MLIVFDTCTKPDYYADVHRLIAMPAGAILRYDYERRLYSEAALKILDAANSQSEPIPTTLFYAQCNTFSKGDNDPAESLSWDNSIFIPTRYAKIVNVAVKKRDNRDRDNIYFHLELGGFCTPTADQIESLIRVLEKRGELPFGRDNSYKWITSFPKGIDVDPFSNSNLDKWPSVVDALATAPSQFAGDVFWRVSHLKKTNAGKPPTELPLVSRATNLFGDSESWHKDYRLDDRSEYSVNLEIYIPHAEEGEIDPLTCVRAAEDRSQLLNVPDEPVRLRRNATKDIPIGVRPFNFLASKYAAVSLSTIVSDPVPAYEPGSIMTLTVQLAKSRIWARIALFFALVDAAVITGLALAVGEKAWDTAIPLAVVSAILTWVVSYAWSGQVIPGKK